MFKFVKGYFNSAPAVNPAQVGQHKEAINALIQANQVTIFSKSWCPYCERAKGRLQGYGLTASVTELDEFDQGTEWHTALTDLTGQRTVPYVWINSKFVGTGQLAVSSLTKLLGGSDDLEALHRNGQLRKMIQQKE